jgi:hypothetical protein
MNKKDREVIEDSGKEWSKFTQVDIVSQNELDNICNGYFKISPDDFFSDCNKVGLKDSFIPLSFYKHSSFYTMRADSLERFGTKLEKSYTKSLWRN